jgi:hypothetical protein
MVHPWLTTTPCSLCSVSLQDEWRIGPDHFEHFHERVHHHREQIRVPSLQLQLCHPCHLPALRVYGVSGLPNGGRETVDLHTFAIFPGMSCPNGLVFRCF